MICPHCGKSSEEQQVANNPTVLNGCNPLPVTTYINLDVNAAAVANYPFITTVNHLAVVNNVAGCNPVSGTFILF